jgi:hypothetical protein
MEAETFAVNLMPDAIGMMRAIVIYEADEVGSQGL